MIHVRLLTGQYRYKDTRLWTVDGGTYSLRGIEASVRRLLDVTVVKR